MSNHKFASFAIYGDYRISMRLANKLGMIIGSYDFKSIYYPYDRERRSYARSVIFPKLIDAFTPDYDIEE